MFNISLALSANFPKIFVPCQITVFQILYSKFHSSSQSCSSELQIKMSCPKRYFINEMPDYSENCASNLYVKEKLKARVMELVNVIETNQPPLAKYGEGGLYVGIAGIAYMFYYLSKSPEFSSRRDDFISKGLEYIKQSEKYLSKRSIRDASDVTGFLLGGSGIHAVAACLFKSTGERKSMESSLSQFIAAGKKCKPIHFLPYGGDELLVGRAGYVSGAIWLNKMFKKEVVPIEEIIAVCKAIYDSGTEYAKSNGSPSPLMYSYYDTEYLGAAHGLSSILQMLISVPEFLQAYPDTLNNIKAAVDFMLSLQTPDGNFPCAMDEVGHRVRPPSEELVHWCHGAPGVVYLMAKAYLIWKEPKYIDSCLKCGELVWKKGLLKKGPGICHGVAGNGYVFLLLYRLTEEKKHLHRAEQFASFLFSKEFQSARRPDSPNSLFEGFAGTVCFLNDLIMPEKAAFPFLDVF